MDETMLASQRDYYRARAGEYDDWWFRRGRYDNGPDAAAAWFADAAEVEAALQTFAPAGEVLELAAGTGIWTRHLVRHAQHVTAIDASREVLAINRDRTGDERVEYVEADLFAWRPPRRYDVCFLGYWLSHVPESRFAGFWELVDDALVPDGRFFLVDSTRPDRAHISAQTSDETAVRTLADGREFEIVKRFYAPAELASKLEPLGWRVDAHVTANGHMLYGSGRRA